jgi:biopolymer transport protein ExbD
VQEPAPTPVVASQGPALIIREGEKPPPPPPPNHGPLLRDSVIVDIDVRDRVHLNGKSVDAFKIAQALETVGAKEADRLVSLVLEEGADPNAIPYIEEHSKAAKLGKVTIFSRADWKSARLREDAILREEAAGNYNPDVVTVEVSKENKYRINGKDVTTKQFPVVLRKIAEDNPGRKVLVFAREPGSSENTIFTVYQATKNSGFEIIEVQ